MALPHPHGSSSGQIAHNANYSTDDTPGSTGGRFVGYGEPGTSAIANRASWALSENIDYVYGKLSTSLAVPAGAAFTSSGQSNYHMTGDVFCGDSSYPGSVPTDAEGMLLLFSVLDAQYNELSDGSGNEVRVASVYDTTNTTPVYKTGFVTNPYIRFRTVNPVTGVEVANPYVIPGTTAVRILYGSRSSVESLPTDALTRYKVSSVEEVPAGVIMQDGSREMVADLGMGGHNLVDVVAVRSDSDLAFRDSRSGGSDIPFSQTGYGTVTTPSTQFPSVLGAIGSSKLTLRALVANRTTYRGDGGGAITYNTDGGNPRATLPVNMKICWRGEIVNVGGLTATFTSDSGEKFLVVSGGNTLARVAAGSVTSDHVVLAYTTITAGSWASPSVDLRYTIDQETGLVSFVVAASGGHFTSLGAALYATNYLANIKAVLPASMLIVVRGAITETVGVVCDHYNWGTLHLRGEGAVLSHATGLGYVFGNASAGEFTTVHMSDISFSNMGVTELGHGSVITGCTFDSTFEVIGDGVTVKNCTFDGVRLYAHDSGSCYSDRFVCEGCVFENLDQPDSSGHYVVHARGDFSSVVGCTISGTAVYRGIAIGYGGLVRNCSVSCTGTSSGGAIYYSPLEHSQPKTPTLIDGNHISGSLFGCYTYLTGGSSNFGGFRFVNNHVTGCVHGWYCDLNPAVSGAPPVVIADNRFVSSSGSTGYAVYLKGFPRAFVRNNVFSSWTGLPVYCVSGWADISGNYFVTCGGSSATAKAVKVDDDTSVYGVSITGNQIDTATSGGAPVILSARAYTRVEANVFTGDSPVNAISLTKAEFGVVERNHIKSLTTQHSIYCTTATVGISHSLEVLGNYIRGASAGYDCVYVSDLSGSLVAHNVVHDLTISTQACGGITLYGAISYSQILHNVIRNISGQGSEDSCIIRIAASGTPEQCVVSGNSILNCGRQAASTVNIISIKGGKHIISNNLISGSKWPSSSGTYASFIIVNAGSANGPVINGNRLVTTEQAYGEFYGIFVIGAAASAVTANYMEYADTNSTTAYGIQLGGFGSVVGNNLIIPDGASDDPANKRAAKVYGEYISAVGNVSYPVSGVRSMDFGNPGANVGVVVGNVSKGGTTVYAPNVTTGNV